MDDTVFQYGYQPGPELWQALAEFQATNPFAEKKHTNPHFRSKYANLDDILAVARQAAKGHGLAISQPMDGDVLVTILAHAKTGQALVSRTRIFNDRGNAQGYGAGVTYARRFGLGALLGIGHEPDDDGNFSAGHVASKKPDPVNRRAKLPEKQVKVTSLTEDAEHDPSWESDAGGFCAAIRDHFNARYDDVRDYCLHKGWGKPSALTQQAREALWKSTLLDPDTLEDFNSWRKS
jgi:hypothetical protein